MGAFVKSGIDKAARSTDSQQMASIFSSWKCIVIFICDLKMILVTCVIVRGFMLLVFVKNKEVGKCIQKFVQKFPKVTTDDPDLKICTFHVIHCLTMHGKEGCVHR